MARSHLKVYFDFDERTEELNDIEKGRLLLAMLRYAAEGQKPDLRGNERFCFPGFKKDIDRDIASYASKVENGNKGGRPAKNKPNETENNLTKPNETENNLNLKNKNEEEEQEEDRRTKSKVKALSRFTPPTQEEVSAYCRERGNAVDPQRFVDFYAAKGWKVGNQPMKDWKAAVRTWEQREQQGTIGKLILPQGKVVTAQRYKQREYSEDELMAVGPDFMQEAKALRDAQQPEKDRTPEERAAYEADLQRDMQAFIGGRGGGGE